MHDNPKQIFSEQQVRFDQLFQRIDARFSLVSWSRVLIFLLFTGTSFYFFYQGGLTYGIVTMIAGFFCFGAIVNFHKRIDFRRRQIELLKKINQEEIDRLDHKLSSFDQGDRFVDDDHSYTSDLDVFGRNSLFQLLNRTATPNGQEKLADWLKTQADSKVIRQRQLAVQELAPMIRWRQAFEALSRHLLEGKDYASLVTFLSWTKEEDDLDAQRYLLVTSLFSLFSTIILVATLSGFLPFGLILIPFLIGLLLIRRFQPTIQEAANISYEGSKLLKSYSFLIDALCRQAFKAELINRLKSSFEGSPHALREIQGLYRLMDYLNNRGNMIYWTLNGLFAIDVYLMIAISKWKRKNRRCLGQWIHVVSEMEALNGLSGYAYAHPEDSFPKANQERLQLITQDLAHPLIPKMKRVSNDFSLDEGRKIGIITGSNMSGKSTFLRTVGVNLVLAQCGAPVCASLMEYSPMGLFTSMRTSDDLEESVSSFYAELKRIERLIRITERNKPVFFLLDEILKGTNTHDRQLGARSLIKQLKEKKCLGLVSTHDISLGELGEREDDLINLHFSSEVVEGELYFDYQLRGGVCKSFNASELMSRIGINLENT